MCSLNLGVGWSHGSEMSVSGVTTICLLTNQNPGDGDTLDRWWDVSHCLRSGLCTNTRVFWTHTLNRQLEDCEKQFPSPSLSTALQLASKAPPRSVTQSNSFFLACISSFVFFCLLVFVAVASPHWRRWTERMCGGGDLPAVCSGHAVKYSCSDWQFLFEHGGFLQMALGAAAGGAWKKSNHLKKIQTISLSNYHHQMVRVFIIWNTISCLPWWLINAFEKHSPFLGMNLCIALLAHDCSLCVLQLFVWLTWSQKSTKQKGLQVLLQMLCWDKTDVRIKWVENLKCNRNIDQNNIL